MADVIESVYEALPAHTASGWYGPIHPFIGSAFRAEGPDALRVMAIGVNAYAGPGTEPAPHIYADAFRLQWWLFQKRALRDVHAVVGALAGVSEWSRPFLGIESIYLTNAVKRWLPQSEGLRAHKAEERWFQEGEPVFARELELLAERGRLPHLILVFGGRPWRHVWPAFGRAKPAFVRGYHPQPGPLYHHINVIDVNERGTSRRALLLRLRHPSAAHYKPRWTPEALTSHPVFRKVAGCDEGTLPAAGDAGGAV